MQKAKSIATSVLGTVGNTPLVQLIHVVAPHSAIVLVNLESINPTGSYKDRMARAMIEGLRLGRFAIAMVATVAFVAGGSAAFFLMSLTGYVWVWACVVMPAPAR